MGVFELQKDGKTYEVEAPDQASALGAFQKMQAATPDTLGDVAKSAVSGVEKGAIGLAGAPADLRNLAASGAKWAFDKLGMENASGALSALQKIGGEGATSNRIRKEIVEPVTGKLHEPQTRAGRYAQSAGEFLPSSMIGPGNIGLKVLGGVTAGLGSEGAGEFTKGSNAEPYARVAGALAGGLAPSGLARAVTPFPANASRQRLVDILNDEGVTSLTAGQRTGSKPLQYAESFLGDAPGAGGQASRMQQEGQRQFTEATMRRAGTGPDATPEVLAQNQARLGQEFADLSARNTLQFDQQFAQDAGRAIRNYERVPPSQQRAMVEGYVNDIIGHMQGGGMPGAYYQEMRSRLSRQANGLRNSDPTLSEALRGLRNALDDGMRRSISPADREAWDTARREYGAQKTIEKAASRAGEATAEGQIIPANLRNAASAENRGAYARGEGPFSELARAGSGVMAPLPNSGTAQRLNLLGILNQATLGAVPAISGRVLMSGPAQAYLGNQLLAGQARQLPSGRQAIMRALMGQERPQLQQQ